MTTPARPQSAQEYLAHGQTPFFRLPCAPQTQIGDPGRFAGAKAVLLGVPYDSGTTYLPGARVAPYHVRRVSALVSSTHPKHRVDVFEHAPALDGGNVPVTPFAPELMRQAVQAEVMAVLGAGAVPFVVGGDHSITTPIMRAIHAVHGPVCVVHVDAHYDTSDAGVWGEEFHHGTPIRHAIEDGHVQKGGLFQVGLRGGWKDGDEAALSLGHEAMLFPASVFEERSAVEIAETIKTAIGDRPVYFSIDVDGVDPSHAPGTGTPVPGGLSSRELLCLLDNLSGVKIVGMDLVEVSPPHDHADLTSMLAAHALFSGLGLLAVHAKENASSSSPVEASDNEFTRPSEDGDR
ncbi:putative agmatinase [Plesiocystis pacifica SIR-1]|uniref:Putative agmatinase n=1 Tax=Plesiocystis pacifica SIR-1 TaxID=391625 RepID=A6G203_9BACT|nr:agmatinase [Plesiocystis pacifica]EDM80193.1 putative agmatinase [Plesiocystis pacifica SIR-1]